VSRFFSLFGLIVGLAMVPGIAACPDLAVAEEWKDRAEVRLIDGGVLADGVTRLAGIEIVLDPEWKTYWRNPGDSGIPPRMDFSASDNVASVSVEWPAPELHYDGYGWVIGYTDAVVFPLLVTPGDGTGPTRLKLKLDYAVCKEICIPAEAEAEIDLDGKKSRAAAIDFYRARVPDRLETATGTTGVVSHSVMRKDGEPVLELHVGFSGDAEDAFAVVEGPEGWYLPVPERMGSDEAGNAVFQVPLDGVEDPATIDGAALLITGISPFFSFEQQITLD
jgi:DsbC/DsbD-like thiol-disulfide interchange protein